MAKGACDVEEFRRLLAEKYLRPVVVFYGEGGRLEETLTYSAASVARWNSGDLNACTWLCQPPRKGAGELMAGPWVEPDPVAIFPAQAYHIGKGTDFSGGAVFTIVDAAGFIVAQTLTSTRQQRGSLSRLILQANHATTIKVDNSRKKGK
jgi:hypothetical protein